jgi:hypothetical protein
MVNRPSAITQRPTLLLKDRLEVGRFLSALDKLQILLLGLMQ